MAHDDHLQGSKARCDGPGSPKISEIARKLSGRPQRCRKWSMKAPPGRHQAAKTKEKMEMVFAPSPLWGPERSARPEGPPESPQDGPKGSGGVGSGLQPPPRDPLPPPRSSPHPTPPPPPPLIPHSPSHLPSPSFSSPLPLVILAFFHSLLLFNPSRYPSRARAAQFA